MSVDTIEIDGKNVKIPVCEFFTQWFQKNYKNVQRMIMSASIKGTVSLSSPTKAHPYFKFGQFGFAPDTFMNIPDMIDNYRFILLAIKKPTKEEK